MDIHSKRGGVKPALATIATICMILSVVIVIKTDVWTLVKGNISQTKVAPVQRDVNFDTKRFDVDAQVGADKSIDIQETIDVDFKNPRRGIIRTIPRTGTIKYKKDGKTKETQFRMNIKDVKVVDDEYNVEEKNGNTVIKIGDEDVKITGRHKYSITYKVQLYGIKEDYDLLAYNFLPQRWMTEIEQSKVNVDFHKSIKNQDIDVEGVDVIYGKKGEIDSKQSDFIKTTKGEKSVTIELTKPMQLNQTVVLRTILPKNFFENAPKLSINPYKGIAAGAVITLACLALWFIFRKKRNMIETVEVKAPDGLSPMQAGYIIDGTYDNEDMIGQILYLAQKGYLKIEQLDGKDSTYKLIKTKDISDDEAVYSKQLFEGLFLNGDTVSLKELPEEFSMYADAAGNAIATEHVGEKSLSSSSAAMIRILAVIMSALPFMAVFANSSLTNMGTVYFPLLGLGGLLTLGLIALMARNYDKRFVKSKKSLYIGLGIKMVLIAVVQVLAFRFIAEQSLIAAVSSIAMTLVASLFAIRIQRPTPYANRMLGRLLGFKTFIKTAEVDRIKLLVDEDPQYFFKVLPYAYIFGLTDKWIKKFETIRIEQPEFLTGAIAYDILFYSTFMSSWTRDMEGEFSALSTVEASTGGLGGLDIISKLGGGGGGGGSW